jgi:hypothetical protein
LNSVNCGRPFKPGQSGNPRGRPKENQEVKTLARKHTKDAIERLVHWMNSTDARASVAASQVLLDRAWGKAVQAHAGQEGEGPVVVEILNFAPRTATE